MQGAIYTKQLMFNIQNYLPFLNWAKPNQASMRKDIVAGISVALVMVPQAVAYAGLANMPLVTGLYACLVPALIATLFASASRLSIGPAALTCVLISASLMGMAEPGSSKWVNLAVWLSILSGLLQVCLGLGGLGWLLNLISAPVLMAFTQAAALLIMGSQVPALLGYKHLSWDELTFLFNLPFVQNPMAWGITSLIFLLLAKKYIPKWPAIMFTVVISASLSYVLDYKAAVVGNMPAGLPHFYMPHWIEVDVFIQLIVPAMVIALVSFLETASSAKIECQRSGQRWDDNQDLISQGLAKLASAFCGSFPTGTSFSRSALMLYAGAQSGWAVIACVAFVLLSLLLLMPVLQFVPRAVLSAIVISAVLGLFQPQQFLHLWRVSRTETVAAGITFVATLLTAPAIYWGVLVGVVLTLMHFLHHRLHPRIIEIGLHPDGSLRDRHLWTLPPLAPHLYAIRMDAEFDFAAASVLEKNLTEHLALHKDVLHVCIFALPINRIDATGVEIFAKLFKLFSDRKITLHISGLKLPVENVLRQSGHLNPDPYLKIYRTDADALVALGQIK